MAPQDLTVTNVERLTNTNADRVTAKVDYAWRWGQVAEVVFFSRYNEFQRGQTITVEIGSVYRVTREVAIGGTKERPKLAT